MITPIFIDFETYWSKTHSLSVMSPMAYVMHPDTQLISMSMKVGYTGETTVDFGEGAIRKRLGTVEWDQAYAIAHNMSEFDAMLLAWRLGVRPRFWGCTLAMARPIHAKTTGLSLAKLVAHYADELQAMGINPVKDNKILLNTQGKRLEDFNAEELKAMARYNADDTEQCGGLFRILAPMLPRDELFHLDCNIRMLVEPQFVVDRQVLLEALTAERRAKRQAIMDVARLLRPQVETTVIDVTDGPEYEDDNFWLQDEDEIAEFVRAELASAPKFAKLLEDRGVEVPMKPSPTNPDKQVPALARTDEAFVAMQEHDDPLVAAAARARLAVKSTLLETRIESFLEVSEAVNGLLPVPLKYSGADTTGRDSGWGYNPQNMPRIPRDKDGNIVPKPSNALRLSLTAPDGHVVGVADQSGIELRVNHTLWKVPSTMALYQQDPLADLYKDFAAFYYDKSVDDISKAERQFAKECQLGLGFGAGAKTFMRVARLKGGVRLDLAQSESAVTGWRNRYEEIVGGWRTCGEALNYIAQGLQRDVDPWGLIHTDKHGLVLPSGRIIRYPDLRYVDTGETWGDGRPKKSWVYATGRHQSYLTGPKVDENIVQALARDSVFECALRFYCLTGLRPRMRVHDELIYIFPASRAAELLELLQKTMRTPPSFWPDLIVWSEGDTAPTYGHAK